ncbi:two-component response regulator [Geomicrobium sp. JCM 19038]|nr:two-component response regulator [Geomicrobium sp. JCM 19038]
MSAQEYIESSLEDIQLCVFDLNLPDGSGYELCKLVKQKEDIPVIFLTVVDDEVNVVMGLDMGADDYITKPFRIRELMSRIKSVLRRYEKQQHGQVSERIEFSTVTISTAEAKVWKSGHEVSLTALEYRLLLIFSQHQGQVLTRAQLLEQIWDVAGDFVNDNTLTVYIKRLREKLEEDPQKPTIIQTVRGLGYRQVINMYRNREFRLFISWQIVIGSIAIGASLLVPNFSLFIVIALVIVMLVSFIVFTTKRYRKIEQLSTYLKEINAGSYRLDVRDNEEGELSILKNDIYKVTSRLAEYNVELEGDRKKLTEAISDISHQLKTPITSMTVMADLLQGSELTPERRVTFTKTIQHQLERMDWLVTSLLKLSKIDAGTIEFKREKVPVKSIITDALNPLLIPIEVKGITLDVEG